MKIGFVIGTYPGEEQERRERVVRSYQSPEVEIEFIRLDGTVYHHQMASSTAEELATPFHRAYELAEKNGCDAVVPLGTLDLGVQGGRSLVDIPVVGPTEACMRLVPLVADNFGAICYHSRYFGFMNRLVRSYGMADRMVGIEASGFDLPDIAANSTVMRDNFLSSARRLITEKGAQSIVPLGITQCPVHMSSAELSEELGVPVVEAIGSPIRLAATLVSLGLKTSRACWPSPDPI